MKILKKLIAAWCASIMVGIFWLVAFSPAIITTLCSHPSEEIAFIVFFSNLTLVVFIIDVIEKKVIKSELTVFIIDIIEKKVKMKH